MRIAALLLLCVFGLGCQRSVIVAVNAQVDPNVDLTKYYTAAVSTETDVAARQSHLHQQVAQAITDDLLTNNYAPLQQATQKPLIPGDATQHEELAHLARNALAGRGVGFSPADPQLLLTIDDLSGPYEYAVPLREIRIASDPPDNAADDTGILADHRTAVLPVRAIALAIYDARKPGKPLWRATAISLHSDQPLRVLAPYLIRAMLDEFPAPSGKPIQREIPLESH
ncbi:MAG: hypothetical protein ACYC26_10415 [Phycisphaerales bacterium]